MAMTGMRAVLRDRAPGAYKAAMLAKNWVGAQTRGRQGMRDAAKLVEERTPIAADVNGRVGMGGLLSWAGRALHVGNQRGVDVALRFTSPTYAPSWPVEDWLDCYYERLGSSADARPAVLAHLLPLDDDPPFEELGRLVWGALRLRPEIVELADTATPSGRFAAVHYRGSDKYLEAPRVAAEAVLRHVQAEMDRDGLEHLFVASDEPSFIDMAGERFAGRTTVLDCEATAVGKVPPHMSEVPGETKAREALATMLILSRASLLVRTESLLSQWSTTLPGERRVVMLNPDTIATS